MNEEKATRDFVVKFNELNEGNQTYIIAIQQALMFAQTSEKAAKGKECDRAS
ncbi:MAG: hypothetical protein ACK5N8_03715 [Alphaproteobacteria bacterium]|uniref:hypothetical protein n=1 Tax=Anaerorhabdus sp. TaxID=1872524 RepID=UPI003A8B03E8